MRTGETTDEETIRVLEALIRLQGPKVLVEAGTHNGYTIQRLAQAVWTHHPEGQVWTADPDDYGQHVNAELAGIRTFGGDFAAMLAEITEPIDFAWLDSGPNSYPMRWQHWQAVLPKMRSGGLMACHDTRDHWPGRQEIVDRCHLTLPYGRGLALYLVP